MTNGKDSAPSAGVPLAALVPAWLRLREDVVRLEAAGHPDLLDGRGRRWAWWKGELYRHGNSAYPLALIPEPVTQVTAPEPEPGQRRLKDA